MLASQREAERERERERVGETRAGYTSVTSLLSAQTHDPPRLTTLTINSQGSPKHLDRARYISIINVANSQEQAFCISRGTLECFQRPRYFKQVYTVARKHGETLSVVKKTVSLPSVNGTKGTFTSVRSTHWLERRAPNGSSRPSLHILSLRRRVAGRSRIHFLQIPNWLLSSTFAPFVAWLRFTGIHAA